MFNKSRNISINPTHLLNSYVLNIYYTTYYFRFLGYMIVQNKIKIPLGDTPAWLFILLVVFLRVPRMHWPCPSLPEPVLRVVFVASNLDGWGNVSFWDKNKTKQAYLLAHWKTVVSFIHYALDTMQTYCVCNIYLHTHTHTNISPL